MSFKDNLVYLRTSNGLTQERLAVLLGVSRQAISKWESDHAYPEMDKLLTICQVFDCGLDDLVQGDLTHPSPRDSGENSTHPTSTPEKPWGWRRNLKPRTSPATTSIGVLSPGGLGSASDSLSRAWPQQRPLLTCYLRL